MYVHPFSSIKLPALTSRSSYLSKAPGAASAYVGDGEWFKIKDFGNSPRGKSVYALSLTDHEAPTFSGGSATWPLAREYTVTYPPPAKAMLTTRFTETYTYQLPKCIENGEYLLRIQSLAIHNPWPAGIPQFYISCGTCNIKRCLFREIHSGEETKRGAPLFSDLFRVLL